MEQQLEFEVKIISNENIKPSLPPSSKTFTLSLLDQTYPAHHIPFLLFYPPGPPSRVDIAGLKSSLSQTLSNFYPFAGRFIDASAICCDNQGVPFVEAQVNTDLSLIMNSPHKLRYLIKFLPPKEFCAIVPTSLSDLIPLAFQINVFLCGGVVIGCFMLHKLLDTTSMATFLNHWACLASERQHHLIQPDFESAIQAFPPLPSFERLCFPDASSTETDSQQSVVVVAKSFVFSSAALSSLKGKAVSELVPQPTRFEALAGFIWEQALAATSTIVKVEKTKLSFSFNMRPWMSKPLRKECMGNLITNAYPQTNETTSKMQDFVKKIHWALSETKEKIKKVYESEDRAKFICQERKAWMKDATVYEEGHYKLSSWCNIGLSEVDFGFGKPNWIVPTHGDVLHPVQRNCMFFTDYDDGIQVWLFLEEKEMRILESNHHFLAFATPH